MDGFLFDKHLTGAEIEAGIQNVLDAPLEIGTLEMIVRRPSVNKREVVRIAALTLNTGW